MNNIRKILTDLNLPVKSIRYQNDYYLINTEDEKFLLREKKNNSKDIYSYLANRDFNYFLPLLNDYNDEYELYPYVNDQTINKSDKAIDLVYLLSLLHNKTTSYETTNLNDIKELFEKTSLKIDNLYKYYLDFQDYIEDNIYMAPAEYLLIRNISEIYQLLIYSKRKIDIWYKEIENIKKERHVLLHQNLKISNVLEDNNKYLTDWSNSKKGPVIYDFLNFYKNEYNNFDMLNLFRIYQSKYQYTKEEKDLFLSLLAIPEKVIFTTDNYTNTIKVRNVLDYVYRTKDFILQEDKEYQKSEKEEFNQ